MILIPAVYKKEACHLGNCNAQTFDNESLVLDCNNSLIDKVEGNIVGTKNNMIIFIQNNRYYFKLIRSDEIVGPFVQLSFVNASKIYGEKENGDKAFYNNDGSIYINDKNIYSSVSKIFKMDCF